MTYVELLKALDELQKRVARAAELEARYEHIQRARQSLPHDQNVNVSWGTESIDVGSDSVEPALVRERDKVTAEMAKIGVEPTPELQSMQLRF